MVARRGRPGSLISQVPWALVTAAGWLRLHGDVWELAPLDGYETPIKDGHLNDVVTGDLDNDGDGQVEDLACIGCHSLSDMHGPGTATTSMLAPGAISANCDRPTSRRSLGRVAHIESCGRAREVSSPRYISQLPANNLKPLFNHATSDTVVKLP